MDPAELIDRLVPDPYGAGVRRLVRRMAVDRGVLRLLRRASEDGAAQHLAAYGWALGVVPDEVDAAGPLTAARAYDEAAQSAAEDPAIQFAFGLAHAGGFGRRRGLPLDARRGFAQAARLDPQNALPHLALAAARFSTGDQKQGLATLQQALASPRYAAYASPVAAAVSSASPWLGSSLSVLWPDRTAEAVRFVLDRLVYDAVTPRAGNDGPILLGHIGAIGRLMTDAGGNRASTFLHGVSAIMLCLRARARLLSDVAAEGSRQHIAPLVLALLDGQRALARDFERATRQTLSAAGWGSLAGAAATVYGAVRAGRAVTWSGVAVATASAATVLAPNPVAAARRRAVEQRLLDHEAELVTAARTRLTPVLDDLKIAPPLPAE